MSSKDLEHQDSQAAQALGRAMAQKQQNNSTANQQANRNVKSVDESSTSSQAIKTVWQHPYVDVFKHFKVLPTQDWKQNKRHGDVQESFAREIGRKVMHISGNISANNFIQMPHPGGMTRSLGLTGRYLYLQVKAPVSATPFAFHIDLGMAERSHGIRISASNLYKQVSTQNGFVLQVPLNLDLDRWTVVVFDMISLLQLSRLLPENYLLEGSYQIKSLTLCANSVVRGVYTSDNEYDFVTMPPDLRFKFSFDINRWPEYFAWLDLPADLGKDPAQVQEEKTALGSAQKDRRQQFHKGGPTMSEKKRAQLEQEINNLLEHKENQLGGQNNNDNIEAEKKAKYEAVQAEMAAMFKDPNQGDDLLTPDQILSQGYGGVSEQRLDNANNQNSGLNLRGLPTSKSSHSHQPYMQGDVKRSPKIACDPIMELRHVIGFSPAKCPSLKWSKFPDENVVIFASNGSLIAMDVETNQQKRFYLGHSAPICCFDVAPHGGLIASAQEGKNSIIRIWEYKTAHCLQFLPMPVTSLKCVSFSPDGRFLASVGKDQHNKELIIVWDISGVLRGEKPEILARQTSEFNVLCLKFSPVDSLRLVSCGKENIRFWRIKETRNIRGSAVVLGQNARDTVFTALDFEYGARASANMGGISSGSLPGSESQERDSLKRVYVAGKQGMIMQVNYLTEKVEATYQTCDSAIYSIAVNEAFCVIGSEDHHLRVWGLDFREFFFEAVHDSIVCAVDFSADGRSIACGTLHGSLGVLDKSNQRYQSLLRSHTDSLIGMDFHIPKRLVITVSKDKSIRLWDLNKFDAVFEYMSQVDQPLCVTAHPTLPLFSCGFESGTMRVFDIEKTCVAESFTQFNKPIRAIAYAPTGDLLVTCCEDGSVALHNARRQHLPTKMMHLDNAPPFVHISFSPVIQREQPNVLNEKINLGQTNMDSQSENTERDGENAAGSASEPSFDQQPVITREALFGIIGEHGNKLMIYSSDSIVLVHQIAVGQIIRSYQFTKNCREVVVVTKDQRIRVYSLARFEGIYLRELNTVHSGAVTTTDLSENGGFMLTGGQDNLLKVWDYDAQTNIPFFYQAFIGQITPVVKGMFNPLDNGMLITASQDDGILIWQFHGDVQTNFHPQDQDGSMLPATLNVNREALHEPTVLERMRMNVKERKKPKLAEFSFIVPEFKPTQTMNAQLTSLAGSTEDDSITSVRRYADQAVSTRELNYTHFVSLSEQVPISIEVEKEFMTNDFSAGKQIEPLVVCGYDGFGGVHDNLIWTPKTGIIIYTLFNKVISENTKTRQQVIYTESEVRISTLALSPTGKLLAVAEGEPNSAGGSNIYLINLTTGKRQSQLKFFQKGVQSMTFSTDGRLLYAVGVQAENSMAIFDIDEGRVMKSALLQSHSINKIVVNPHVGIDDDIEFVTIGAKGYLQFWRIDIETGDLSHHLITVPEHLAETDFVSACYTSVIGEPYNQALLLLGTHDGAILAFKPAQVAGGNAWVEQGQKRYVINEQIGQISIRKNQVVIAGSKGTVAKYSSIVAGNVLPPDDMDDITQLKADSAVQAISLDDLNGEGFVGTADGNIQYFNFSDKVMIKLVAKVSPGVEPIPSIKFDQSNPSVFLTTTQKETGDLKLYASQTLDQIMKFPSMHLGPVAFIIASPKNKKQRIVGHERGFLKILAIDSLKVSAIYQIDLQDGEYLTCGAYSPSGLNFAIGTSFGSIYLGMIKKDPYGGNKQHFCVAHVDKISKTTEHAVTSIQLTTFDPHGSLLAAFDNGDVRVWQSTLQKDLFEKLIAMRQLGGKKSKKAMQMEISEMGQVQFDVIDKFNLFDNPHGLEVYNEDDEEQINQLYQGRAHSDCEAIFAAGSSGVDHLFARVGVLPYIFVRNYVSKQTVNKIVLENCFPTSLCVLDYYKLSMDADLPVTRGGLQAMCVVGTKEGKVLCYRVDATETKLLLKTRGGMLYGEVTALSTTDTGLNFLVATSSGEVFLYELLRNLIGLEQ